MPTSLTPTNIGPSLRHNNNAGPTAFTLNVLLPVGNLGQEGTWRPETGTWGGRIAQFAVWFETLFGWMAGLILVAVVSGLAKRDE